MKKLFSFVCVVLFTVTASAQVTWNVKAGLGIANYIGDDVDAGSHFVGKIGAGIEKPFTQNWSLMPSLELAWKGAKYEEKFGQETYSETLDIFYLQIPVLAAYRFNVSDHWNITLKTGPYLACGVYGQYKSSFADIESDSNIFSEDVGCKRLDFGWDTGIDFECKRFVFGVEYEIGFVSFGPEDSSIKNSAFYATLGYKF